MLEPSILVSVSCNPLMSVVRSRLLMWCDLPVFLVLVWRGVASMPWVVDKMIPRFDWFGEMSSSKDSSTKYNLDTQQVL